jgi:integrase
MSWRNDYKKISVGILRHKKMKTFYAEKKVRGKVYNKTFSNLYDAKQWRKSFDGLEEKKTIENVKREPSFSTLREVWCEMQRTHFPTLATTTKAMWRRRYSLLKNLEHLRMDQITPSKMTSWVNHYVKIFSSEKYKNSGRGRATRCTMNNELNMFVTIFNWYKESEQFEKEAMPLTCPVKKKHRKMGFIRPVPDKKMQIDLEHAFIFFELLKPIYSDLAQMQFYCAGRVGETAGLQWSNVDFDNRRLLIKNTCIWCMTKKTFKELKPFPKNREPRAVFVTDEIMAILKRRQADNIDGDDFVFHVNGRPLNYGTIQLNYRQAQKRGKLPYSGTHILRHGMAKLARKVGGGLDAVIAMTGHKDLKLADHYSSCNEDDQKEFSLKIMDHIRKSKAGHHQSGQSAANVLSISSFKSGTKSSDQVGKSRDDDTLTL